MSDVAIQAEDVGKRFRIGQSVPYRRFSELPSQWGAALKKRLQNGHAGRTASREWFWALKNISFEVRQGEVLGIIGRNGAGKSTLLKIISRITEPTEGQVEMWGRVGSLLEVGTGFHPELTGRENIFLNGAVLGMRRSEIRRNFDEIVAFAEIERFIDTPVKHYSSGMYMRLAFAVAAHLDPEILLVDEVLAVGDAAFQRKCLGKMSEVARGGRTVLFVSHNMAAIESLCQRALLLERGQVALLGTQREAVDAYLRGGNSAAVDLRARTDRRGSGDVRVTGIQFRDADGQPLANAASGQDVEILLAYERSRTFNSRSVTASIMVKTSMDVPVFLHHNRLTGQDLGTLPEVGAFVCRLPRLPLPPSTYRISYAVLNGSDYLDAVDSAAEFQVVEGNFFGSAELPPQTHGVCLVDARWHVEAQAPAERPQSAAT